MISIPNKRSSSALAQGTDTFPRLSVCQLKLDHSFRSSLPKGTTSVHTTEGAGFGLVEEPRQM